MRRFLIAALAQPVRLAVVLAVAGALPAAAHWHRRYAALPQWVQDWYAHAELTPAAQRRIGFVGCCDSGDVVISKFKPAQDAAGAPHWFYLKNGAWVQIPDDIVHWEESAPDNKPTLFALSNDTMSARGMQPAGTLTCFYPPSGGF